MKYNYDVWGNTVSVINSQGVQVSETSSNNSIIQPFRYRGYCFDKETGYYYLQSRYYDPVICRFINADLPEYAKEQKEILIIGCNNYVYCYNSPINYEDKKGNASYAMEEFMKKIVKISLLIFLSIVFLSFFWITYDKGAYSIIFLAIGSYLFVEGLDVVFNFKRFRNILFVKKKNAKKKHK